MKLRGISEEYSKVADALSDKLFLHFACNVLKLPREMVETHLMHQQERTGFENHQLSEMQSHIRELIHETLILPIIAIPLGSLIGTGIGAWAIGSPREFSECLSAHAEEAIQTNQQTNEYLEETLKECLFR